MKKISVLMFFLLSIFLSHLNAANGLTGAYYNKNDYRTLKGTQTDPTISFNWGNSRPSLLTTSDNFSIIWTGYIYVPEIANYTFYVAHDDYMDVSIGGTQYYSNGTWTGGDTTYNNFVINNLTAGFYPITIDFQEYAGGAYARFGWKNSASLTTQTIVPQTNLFTSIPSGPKFSISNASLVEGNSGYTTMQFTVTLSQAANASVQYNTADGTATAGSDYNTTNGTLTFTTDGNTTKIISVPIQGDTFIENNETFMVNLSNATNAYISTGTATGTIINDDMGYCAQYNLTQGYHIIAPDGNTSHSFEIYCDRSNPNDIKDVIKLPLSKQMATTEFSNFKFNASLGTGQNYYDDSNAKTYINYIRIDARTLEIIPDNTSGFFDGDFSNLNLRGTPFTFDWNNMSSNNIVGCTLNNMRRDYDISTQQGGQVLKINPKKEDVYKCTGKNLKLKLLDDYKFVIYNGGEVLKPSCKQLSEQLPANGEFANITGYFYIDPKIQGRDGNQQLSDYRPFVAYCMEVAGSNAEDKYSWTMFLTLDGVRTENHSDITNGKDTCSNLGLFFFVPNSQLTFNKARTFLYDQKAQWSPYTGQMGEYFTDRNIDGWGKSYETSRYYWPYGPMGLYYDDGSSSDGILDPGAAGSWTPITNGRTINGKTYGYDLTSSSEVNGTSINIAHISAGNTVTGWKTTLEEMGYPADFWISTFSAGDFYNSAPICNGSTINCYLNARSREPNGDYTYGNWMHFWADDNGNIYHYNDQGFDGTLNDRYRHDHYMCMAKDNYQFAIRYKLSPGPYNVVNEFSSITTTDPTDPSDVQNALLTQIAGKSFNVKVLSLQDDLQTLKTSESSVLLDVVDATSITDTQSSCTNAPILYTNDANMGVFFNDHSSVIHTNTLNFATTNTTYRVKYVDWGKFFLASGIQCSDVSNMSANLKGVPQCLNSTSKIKDLFATKGIDVSLCTDGTNRACDSNMYTSSGVNTAQGSIIPSQYNHNYGCLSCLTDIAGSYACARDNFSIRPATYSIDLNETRLYGGKPYNLSINATRYGVDTNVSGYDQVIDNGLEKNATQALNLPITCTSLSSTPTVFSNTIQFLSGHADTNYTYNNVGDINFTVTDTMWTWVDQSKGNGKGYDDCIVNSNSNILDANGKVGCSIQGLKQSTFLPSRFINLLSLKNANNNTFTYISSEQNMSAQADINISAVLDNNTTATNYTAKCFSKDINTTISLIKLPPNTEWLTNASNAINRILFFGDKNTTVSELTTIGTSKLSTTEGNFTNGTANITIDFNFDRNISRPDEPFHIAKNDFNISVCDTNDVNGSDFNRNNDINTTFYYGRVYSTDYRGQSPIPTTIRYEIYCKNCNKSDLNITGVQSPTSLNWYQNNLHNDLTSGQVTAFTPRGTTVVNPAASNAIANGFEANTLSLGNGTLAPYTDRIRMTPSSWLIYNLFNASATTNDFNVEFITSGSWAGEGNLGKTVDVNSSVRTNRRMEW